MGTIAVELYAIFVPTQCNLWGSKVPTGERGSVPLKVVQTVAR